MKVSIVILIALFLVQAQCEKRFSDIFKAPSNIYESIANKANQFTDYVSQQSKNIKRRYIDDVRNKILQHFTLNLPRNNEKFKNIDKENDFITENIRPSRTAMKSGVRKAPNRILDNNLNKTYYSSNSIIGANAPIRRLKNYSDDDPKIQMTTPQLVALYGYRAESHTVITEDGYLLTIHRIPGPKGLNQKFPSKTILLHHGLLGSSADWVIPGPNKGLAYILSDAGYDVWMANVRGNTYSRAHVSRPVSSYAFWNFTFHEVSQYDLPAVIDYIRDIKGWDVKINYIGHSMGTTILFALLSTKTQYNNILRAGYALAPVAYMTDIKSPLKILSKFSSNIEYLIKLIGVNEFLPQNSVLKWLSKHACEINHYEEAICENSMFVICGHDPLQFNQSLLPMILGHTPAGASTKTLLHYAQIIHNDGRFQQFDYGAEGNLKIYGKVIPPEYPIHQITLPIALLSAQNDWLSSDTDATNLFLHLKNPIEHFVVPFKDFNHIDFLWAIDAPKLVYKKLLQILSGNNETIFPFEDTLQEEDEI